MNKPMNKPIPPRKLLPSPILGESPTDYADRLGRWYGQIITEAHRKSQGHYLTPPSIATFMGRLACPGAAIVRILDPAAGSGTLAAAACEALAKSGNSPTRIEVVAYEVDPALLPVIEACFGHLSQWLLDRGIELHTRIEIQDFILANAGALEGGLLPASERPFDAV